jgi:hypothetical protein
LSALRQRHILGRREKETMATDPVAHSHLHEIAPRALPRAMARTLRGSMSPLTTVSVNKRVIKQVKK